MNALNRLFEQTIDYAGLFPPAGLPIDQAVNQFYRYRNSRFRSRLGRLVVNWKDLVAIEESARELNPRCDGDCWAISALLPTASSNGIDGSELQQALQVIADFNLEFAPSNNQSGGRQAIDLVVDSLEIKVSNETQLKSTTAEIQKVIIRPTAVFLEIDCQTDPTAFIKQVSTNREQLRERQSDACLYGKIRTGSMFAAEIPGISEVARFIECCSLNRLPFKATAGLHHPIRNEYRLTYQPDSPSGTMHGYINMFFAALLSFEYQLGRSQIEAILSETETAHFQFNQQGLHWNEFSIPIERIGELRQQSLISFGSCSFAEPTTELETLYQDAAKPI